MQQSNRIALALTLGLIVMGFQNCSPVNFDKSKPGLSVTKTGDGDPQLPDEQPTDDDTPVVNDPPVVDEPPANPPLNPTELAALCTRAEEMAAKLTPGSYNHVELKGSGKLFSYAKSVDHVDLRGSGRMVILGSADNTGIEDVDVRGSGELVICGMDVDKVKIRGSGVVRLVGGNILSDIDTRGSFALLVYDEEGNLIEL
jgi:hypothetical protein